MSTRAVLALALAPLLATGCTQQPPAATGIRPTPSGALLSVTVCGPPPATLKPASNPILRLAAPPPATLVAGHGYCAYIATSAGTISIRVLVDRAPEAANSFAYLAGHGHYDGAPTARCPGATDPLCLPGATLLAIGTGGEAGYTLPAEPAGGDYVFGTVAMEGTGGRVDPGRLFISLGDNRALPPRHPVIGQVTDGLVAAAGLASGAAILATTVVEG